MPYACTVKIWSLHFPGKRSASPKFVLKSISCFFLFAARVVSKAVISRVAPQSAIESLSVLVDESITQIIWVYSTVATFYQWLFLTAFNLNGGSRLRGIIKV